MNELFTTIDIELIFIALCVALATISALIGLIRWALQPFNKNCDLFSELKSGKPTQHCHLDLLIRDGRFLEALGHARVMKGLASSEGNMDAMNVYDEYENRIGKYMAGERVLVSSHSGVPLTFG